MKLENLHVESAILKPEVDHSADISLVVGGFRPPLCRDL